jgi:hypothetical protein
MAVLLSVSTAMVKMFSDGAYSEISIPDVYGKSTKLVSHSPTDVVKRSVVKLKPPTM